MQNQRRLHSLRATVRALSLHCIPHTPPHLTFGAASRVINMPGRRKAEKPNRREQAQNEKYTKPNPDVGEMRGKCWSRSRKRECNQIKKVKKKQATRPWSNKARLHLWVVLLLSVVCGGELVVRCSCAAVVPQWWLSVPFGVQGAMSLPTPILQLFVVRAASLIASRRLKKGGQMGRCNPGGLGKPWGDPFEQKRVGN